MFLSRVIISCGKGLEKFGYFEIKLVVSIAKYLHENRWNLVEFAGVALIFICIAHFALFIALGVLGVGAIVAAEVRSK